MSAPLHGYDRTRCFVCGQPLKSGKYLRFVDTRHWVYVCVAHQHYRGTVDFDLHSRHLAVDMGQICHG